MTNNPTVNSILNFLMVSLSHVPTLPDAPLLKSMNVFLAPLSVKMSAARYGWIIKFRNRHFIHLKFAAVSSVNTKLA